MDVVFDFFLGKNDSLFGVIRVEADLVDREEDFLGIGLGAKKCQKQAENEVFHLIGAGSGN